MIESIPHSDRNLILTGFASPNQLTLARRLAERLTMPFVNFEARLEARADLPMIDIRQRFGEARLKTLEAEVVEEMILYRGAIILISGETLMHGDNLDRLSETGIVLCLTATLDAALQRLHLSMGARYHNPAERSMAVGQLRREWAVRKRGVREFDTTGQTDAEIVEALAALWREQALVTRG